MWQNANPLPGFFPESSQNWSVSVWCVSPRDKSKTIQLVRPLIWPQPSGKLSENQSARHRCELKKWRWCCVVCVRALVFYLLFAASERASAASVTDLSATLPRPASAASGRCAKCKNLHSLGARSTRRRITYWKFWGETKSFTHSLKSPSD